MKNRIEIYLKPVYSVKYSDKIGYYVLDKVTDRQSDPGYILSQFTRHNGKSIKPNEMQEFLEYIESDALQEILPDTKVAVYIVDPKHTDRCLGICHFDNYDYIIEFWRNYVLTYNGRKLSSFYLNDIPDVFAFRKNDWMIFHSQEEAQKKLDYIQKEIHDPDNVERYGDFAKKHRKVAQSLQIKQT